MRHQTPADWAILGLDDPIASGLAGECRGRLSFFSLRQQVEQGAYLSDDAVVLRHDGVEHVVCRTAEIRLLGEHNRLNVLASVAIAAAAGVGPEAIARGVTGFAGVEHRLEPVRTIDGVTFYNDSIATAPERACAALRSFERPIVLIAGGRSKHLPLGELARLVVERCQALVTIGEMAEEIEQAVRACAGSDRLVVRRAGDLEAASRLALELARPGDVVLLSPAGTSFDAFRDFEERGRRFKEIVLGL